jgi:hypothetical protein
MNIFLIPVIIYNDALVSTPSFWEVLGLKAVMSLFKYLEIGHNCFLLFCSQVSILHNDPVIWYCIMYIFDKRTVLCMVFMQKKLDIWYSITPVFHGPGTNPEYN